MAAEHFARLEVVVRAAIRAARLAGVGDVQEDARVVVPQRHASHWAGAEHTAVFIEVLGQQFDAGSSRGGCVAHRGGGQTKQKSLGSARRKPDFMPRPWEGLHESQRHCALQPTPIYARRF